MNEAEADQRDQPDADPASGQLGEQDLDSVAGGNLAKIDAFTVKQGIKSVDGEDPVKAR